MQINDLGRLGNLEISGNFANISIGKSALFHPHYFNPSRKSNGSASISGDKDAISRYNHV